MTSISILASRLRELSARDTPFLPLRCPGPADLAIPLHCFDHTESATGLPAYRQTLGLQGVESVWRSGPRILLRLEDKLITEAALDLEHAVRTGATVDDENRGTQVVVGFCDPNATKSLHVGHLRNIALGHALAAAFEQTGAVVERQAQVSDAGQQFAEAMAGYTLYGGELLLDNSIGRADQEIGALYARYVQEHSPVLPEQLRQGDRPLARELSTGPESLATNLLYSWSLGEESLPPLWALVRNSVVAGQVRTLKRLDIGMDRILFESDYGARISRLVDTATKAGVFRAAESGAVAYETDREEYPSFPLIRSDGLTTLNLRSLAIWQALTEMEPSTTVISVCGAEWEEHTACVEEILCRFYDRASVKPTHNVLHGMVHTDSGPLSSSRGEATLIDELLDALGRSEALRVLRSRYGGQCEMKDLAKIAALGYCLDHHLMKEMRVTQELILDRRLGTGLHIAEAWSKALNRSGSDDVSPNPHDPSYRFVVLQSFFLSRYLRQCVDWLDPLPLLRYIARLSVWYVEQRPDPQLDRLMFLLLTRSLRCVGLIDQLSKGPKKSSDPSTVYS